MGRLTTRCRKRALLPCFTQFLAAIVPLLVLHNGGALAQRGAIPRPIEIPRYEAPRPEDFPGRGRELDSELRILRDSAVSNKDSSNFEHTIHDAKSKDDVEGALKTLREAQGEEFATSSVARVLKELLAQDKASHYDQISSSLPHILVKRPAEAKYRPLVDYLGRVYNQDSF